MKALFLQNINFCYPLCFGIYILSLSVILFNTRKILKLLKTHTEDFEDLTISDIILTIICGVSLPCGFYIQLIVVDTCPAFYTYLNVLLCAGFVAFALFVSLLGILSRRKYSKV